MAPQSVHSNRKERTEGELRVTVEQLRNVARCPVCRAIVIQGRKNGEDVDVCSGDSSHSLVVAVEAVVPSVRPAEGVVYWWQN